MPKPVDAVGPGGKHEEAEAPSLVQEVLRAFPKARITEVRSRAAFWRPEAGVEALRRSHPPPPPPRGGMGPRSRKTDGGCPVFLWRDAGVPRLRATTERSDRDVSMGLGGIVDMDKMMKSAQEMQKRMADLQGRDGADGGPGVIAARAS